ncbi:MAG: CSLREA domain-containing protein, partial [Rubrivivax sp.]|nr:CSLREA domain-containing protein [Pyrinomonadaceae bacterium]
MKRDAAKETPEGVTLKAEKRGFPLINLRDGKKFGTKYVGAHGAAQSFAATQARPLTMTNADLNADGAGDLVVGYAGGDGGHLALYQGSLDTLSARTPEIFEGMKEGRFPAPFLPEVRLIQLPAAPDFIGTGDFNRDGFKDIVAAGRGDNKAMLLFGDGKNSFTLAPVELPGRVTAMLADNIDPLDNAADVAVAVVGEGGASLLVYNGATNAFGETPEIYPLPAEAASLAIGQLDKGLPMDILAAVGGQVAIIHGSYAGDESSRAEQVETLDLGSDVAAVRVGNFIWDRENCPEIGLLTADGSVRILQRGKLNKRMFTTAEWKTRWKRHREEAMAQEAVRRLDYQPRQSETVREKWTEADSFQIAAPLEANRAFSSTSFFTSARMTPSGVEDLLVIDSASRKLHILVSNNEQLKNTGESLALSASGTRAAVTLDAEGTLVAALPMRLSVMTRPGIVTLDKENNEISLSIAPPVATFNVTKTADTFDGSCTVADCSFREALQAANAANTSDLIMVPTGTYTINPALGGPDQDTTIDPAAQQSGDWDVFFDTTITGAGQATTILQAGATTASGHDRVLDAIQGGVGFPDLSINGVTLANGRCRADFPCVDGGGLRFAVDALAELTISDSTVRDSRAEVNTANPANNGGGIFAGQADYNFTNLTVTNNIAGFATGGCTNCGSEGGGAIVAFTNSANPTSLTITNSTFTGNHARTTTSFGGRGGAIAWSPNSVSITGGTFSNNMADINGGAFRVFTATTISGATISNNSAKHQGGGIYNDPLDNQNNPLTNTYTNLTMKGNIADSNNAHVVAGGEVTRGDGGAIYHGRGTLNLTGSTIGGTGAGEANTAFNGGGIGHSYAEFLSAAFNASTININGGSIVGNLAINNGGGVLNDATRSASGSANALNIGSTTAVTFTNNSARNHGGGIAMLTASGPTPAASATLNNMTLRNNAANSDSSGGGDGGALYQDLAVGGGGTTFTGTLTVGGSGFANSAVNGGGLSNAAGTLTIPNNASITFNTATGNGGGILNGGTVNNFTGATVGNNSAANGGGIATTGGALTMTGGSIQNNTATINGGAVHVTNGTATLSNLTITSNAATSGSGGAFFVSGGTLNASLSRIANNTAFGSTAIARTGGTANVQNNWWGCDGFPGSGTAGCPTAGGAFNAVPRIDLQLTASPTSVLRGGTSTLTADVTKNTDGNNTNGGNAPSVLVGLNLTFDAGSKGSINPPLIVTVPTDGTETKTFTANANSAACGAATPSVTLDNGTQTASITVQCPDLTMTKTNNVAGSAVVGQQWTWTLTVANIGGVSSTNAVFTSGQTVLSDNLPDSANITYGSPTSSNANVTCLINGTKDLSCTAGASGLTLAPGASFTVQFTATATAPATYANPRVVNGAQVDPNNNVVESDEGNNGASNSVVVTKANTSVALTSSQDPSVFGQSVTFTATVAVSAPGAGTPTGTVNFLDGGNPITGCQNVALA